MKMRRVLAVLLGGVVFVVGGIVYLTNINRLVENPEDDDDLFDEDFDDDFFEDEEDEVEKSVSDKSYNKEESVTDEEKSQEKTE